MKSRFWFGLFLLSASGLSQAATSAFYVAPGANGSLLVSTPITGSAPQLGFSATGGYFIDVDSSIPGSPFEAEVSLSGPNATRIQPGVYEAGRTFSQDPGTSGFDFSFDGRGPNASVSLINVLEVAYDSNGVLTKLAVDFTQYEDTPTSSVGQNLTPYHSDVGSLRFNSDIPLTVPEPSASLVFVAGMAGVVLKRRRQVLRCGTR